MTNLNKYDSEKKERKRTKCETAEHSDFFFFFL